MIDYYFNHGTAHEVCEDYICSAKNTLFLSDGCSSAKNTDIGSRVLTLMAKKHFKDYWISDYEYSYDDIFNKIIFDSEVIINNLGINIESLFATLIVLKTTDESKYLSLSFIGDGVAAFERHDGSIQVYDVEFARNAPKYLAYRLKDSYRNQFHNIFGNDRSVTIFDIIDGQKTNIEKSIDFNYNNYSDIKTFCINKTQFKNAVIFSDGVKSFSRDTGENVPLENIITDLVNFKCVNGNFVKRRVNRFYKNKQKQNINHYDDLAMAAIHLG